MSDYPYPGLRPFKHNETDIFFGRDEQVDELLAKLESTRFISVVGPSGCGKSSLVKAGFVAGLEAGLLASTGAHWQVAMMRPGVSPMRWLAECLAGPLGLSNNDDANTQLAIDFLQADLERGPLGLVQVFRETQLPERTNLLLIVDQFEEIFRCLEDGDIEEARAFVALLLETAKHPDVPIYITLTMRSEYLGDCALFHGLPEAINEGQFLTPRLTRRQIRATIEGPAGAFGATVEPALVNHLLNDMGANQDQLPLMQHVLMRMWMLATRHADATDSGPITLTLAHYKQAGGIDRALSMHADAAYESLTENQKRIAESMFRTLTQHGAHDRDVRRPAPLKTIAAVADETIDAVIKVVDVFRQPGRSFITPPVQVELQPETLLDISHESLIRQWNRLNGWVSDEANSANSYRRLDETAKLYDKKESVLLRGPELAMALDWKSKNHPTPEWGDRYGGNYQAAMDFLAKSRLRRTIVYSMLATAAIAVLMVAPLSMWVSKRAEAKSWILSRAYLSNVLSAQADWEHRQGNSTQSALLARQAFDARLIVGSVSNKYSKALISENRIRQEIQNLPPAILPDSVALHESLKRQLEHKPGESVFSDAFDGHQDVIRSTALSADGKWLATSSAKVVRLFRLADHSKEAEIEHEGVVRTLAFSPDSRWLAVGGTKPELACQDSNQCQADWECTRGFCAGPPATVRLYDLNTSVKNDTDFVSLETDSGWIGVLAFQPSSNPARLAAGGRDGKLRFWEYTSGDTWNPIINCPNAIERSPVLSLVFDPKSDLIATGNNRGAINIWRTNFPLVHADSEASLNLTASNTFATDSTVDDCPGLTRIDTRSIGEVDLTDVDPAVRSLAIFTNDTSTWLFSTVRFQPNNSDSEAPRNQIVPESLLSQTNPVSSLRQSDSETSSGQTIPESLINSTGSESSLNQNANWDHNGVTLWRLDSDRLSLHKSIQHSETITSLAYGETFEMLYAGTEAGKVIAWELSDYWDVTPASETPPKRLLGQHKSKTYQIALAKDGDYLASVSEDPSARLWKLQSASNDPPKEISRLDASGAVRSIVFDPHCASMIVVADSKGKIERVASNLSVQNTTANDDACEPKLLADHNGESVRVLAFNPDGTYLASGSAFLNSNSSGGTAALWDVSDGRWVATPDSDRKQGVWAAAFAPAIGWNSADPQWLAIGGYDRKIRIWDVNKLSASEVDLAPEVTLETGRFGVRSIAFSPDGKRLAAATDFDHRSLPDAGAVFLWDVDIDDPSKMSGEHIKLSFRLANGETADELGTRFSGVSFSPDGKHLVASSWDGLVRVWNIDNRSADPNRTTCPQVEFFGDRKDASTVSFSPDGRLIAVGHRVGAVVVWDMDLALNLDQIDSGESRGDVECKNTRSLQKPLIFENDQGHVEWVHTVAFNPDSRWLLSGGEDGKIRTHELSRSLAEKVCDRAGRNLTLDEWSQFVGDEFKYSCACPGKPGPPELCPLVSRSDEY